MDAKNVYHIRLTEEKIKLIDQCSAERGMTPSEFMRFILNGEWKKSE